VKFLRMFENAVRQGILPERPAPACMTMILLDDDGLIVSCPITHEALEDGLTATNGRPLLPYDVLGKMLDERRRLRGS
jgi:hypothetical protein